MLRWEDKYAPRKSQARSSDPPETHSTAVARASRGRDSVAQGMTLADAGPCDDRGRRWPHLARRIANVRRQFHVMKILWCWRCKMDVPMLEDDEWSQVLPLIGHGSRGATLHESIYGSFLAEYQRITGFKATNPAAVFHHRASLYGPLVRTVVSRCVRPWLSSAAPV
jgi:hypothetical protein